MESINEIKNEANRCLGCKNTPCTNKCPLNNDIPTFIKYIKEENYKMAYKTLLKTSVLSSVCGRICPYSTQCQAHCTRGIKGKEINIGKLEAFVSDWAINNNFEIETSIKNNIRVAIIGAGPAGLTCGAFLAINGIDVTIYEKSNHLGGLLSHGIPDFRLSKEIVEATINRILNLGIKVEYNCKLGSNIQLNTLRKEYDAIFLAIGANTPKELKIRDNYLSGIYYANEILEFNNHPDYKNKIVSVYGGGNVAIDMARTAIRKGAKKVYIIYRRNKELMPAENAEVQDAVEDDIEFLFTTRVINVIGKDKVEKLECVKTNITNGEVNDVQGTTFLVDTDYIMFAVGSKPDSNINLDLNLDENGYIIVNKDYMTSKEGVFAGGDLIGTKATVAWASKAGREAAKEIIKYVKRKGCRRI